MTEKGLHNGELEELDFDEDGDLLGLGQTTKGELPDEGDLDDLFGGAFDKGKTPVNGGAAIFDTEPVDAVELQQRMEEAQAIPKIVDIPTEVMSEAAVAKALSEAEIQRLKETLEIPKRRKRSQTPTEGVAEIAEDVAQTAADVEPTHHDHDPDPDPDLILQTLNSDSKPLFSKSEEAELDAAADAAEQNLTVEQQLSNADRIKAAARAANLKKLFSLDSKSLDKEALEAADKTIAKVIAERKTRHEAERNFSKRFALKPYANGKGQTIPGTDDLVSFDSMLANDLGGDFGAVAVGLDRASGKFDVVGSHSTEGTLPDEVAEEQERLANDEYAQTDVSIKRPVASLELVEAPEKRPSTPSQTVAIGYAGSSETDTSFPAFGYSLGMKTPEKGLTAAVRTTTPEVKSTDPWAEVSPSEAFETSSSAAKPSQMLNGAAKYKDGQLNQMQISALSDFKILFQISDTKINDFRYVKNELDRLVENAEKLGVKKALIIDHLHMYWLPSLYFSVESFNNKHIKKAVQNKLGELGVIVKSPGFFERNWKKAAAAVALIGTAVGLGTWKLYDKEETDNGGIIASNNDDNDDLNIKKAANVADDSLKNSAMAGAMVVASELEATGGADFWADFSAGYGDLEGGAEDLMLDTIETAENYSTAAKEGAEVMASVGKTAESVENKYSSYKTTEIDRAWDITGKWLTKTNWRAYADEHADLSGLDKWELVAALSEYSNAMSAENKTAPAVAHGMAVKKGKTLYLPENAGVLAAFIRGEAFAPPSVKASGPIENVADERYKDYREFRPVHGEGRTHVEISGSSGDSWLNLDGSGDNTVVSLGFYEPTPGELSSELAGLADQFNGSLPESNSPKSGAVESSDTASMLGAELAEFADQVRADVDAELMKNLMPSDIATETKKDAMKWSNTDALLAEWDAEDEAEAEWENMLADWGTEKKEA